jgi:hypothetical protein
MGTKAFAVELVNGKDLYLITGGFGVTNKFRRVAAALLPISAKRSLTWHNELNVIELNKKTKDRRLIILTVLEVKTTVFGF